MDLVFETSIRFFLCIIAIKELSSHLRAFVSLLNENKLKIYGKLLNANLIYTILGLIRPKHTTNLNSLRICVECESRLHNFWFDKVRKIIKK